MRYKTGGGGMNLLTPDEITALLLSLKISSVAVAASLPFAAAAALLLGRRFSGKTLVDGIIHLPLVLPPVAVGFILLMLLGTRAGLGALLLHWFGITLVFRWTGAALTSAIVTFPFQVRAIRLALEAQDRGLSEAARTLGAGRLDRLFNITLPLALPGLAAGAITAFAASLGEFGAIITFVSNIPGETRTLPLAIYTALQTPGGEAEAARLSALSILLALVFMIAAQWLMRRAAAREDL
jgi:molybdate transport system permease protein